MLSHESRYIAFLASFINAICPGEFITPVLDQNEPEEGMEQEETTGMSMGM